MKHNKKITIILLSMFLIAQFIGLVVVHSYSPIQTLQINPLTGEIKNKTIIQPLPYRMQPPEIEAGPNLISIIISFIIAITLILILSKYKFRFLIRAWFFVVVTLALGISFNAFIKTSFTNSAILAFAIALPLSFLKIYRPQIILHNITELFIYPGIAAVFVSILNVWTIIILLILISIYDIWAVWHSGIMQKMAKFQIQELNIFGGFFVPYADKKTKKKIKLLRQKYKNKIPEKVAKKSKLKISLAILGGGDVVFPIITAGVFLRIFGLIPALFVIFGAFAGLTYLFITSKKKPYPAMPFITAGIFAGLILWWVVRAI